ncbi:MAG TPA: polysaccharide deacetylase family protein [Gemmatimonadaceae bacterium]
MKLRSNLASLAKQIGARISAGLYSLFGSRSDNAFGILMYHRVTDERAGIPVPTGNVTPARFRDQMEGLLARGYRVWSLRTALTYAREGRAIPAKTAVVTFDDGYRNLYEHAWPVLRELRIPATIFAATAFVDSTSPFPFDRWGTPYQARTPPVDWQPLTWTQCREMERSAGGLVEIGSHSHTHVDFRGNADELRRDLASSLATLRDRLGRNDFTFSFAYGGRRLGYASDSLMRVALASGALCALTTETELATPRTSPFGWGRLEVVQSDTADTIAAKLEGWYNWMGRARDLFRAFAPPPAAFRAARSSNAAS